MQTHKRLSSDLLIVLVWTVLTVIFVLTPFLADTTARAVLGIPLVLFIPGYVLITALFPRKDDLELIERIALSFGLSIAVVPLIGLGLNFTPFGIRLVPVLLALCIYTFALISVSVYRREKVPEEKRFFIPFHKTYELIKNEISASGNRLDRILTVILIFSIIIAVGTTIYVIVTPKIGEKFTEFYILGPEGKADNYPTNLRVDSPSTILVGVVNHEYAYINYTVRVTLDGNILNVTRLSLDHNGTWEQNITFMPDKEGRDLKLEFLLFKEDNFSAPYRDLHLWVNVSPMVTIIPTPVSTPVIEAQPTGKKISIEVNSRRGFIPQNQPSIPGNIIEIQQGDEVVWSNDDEIPVTLVSDIPGFTDRLLDLNKRTSYIFTKAGTYHFHLENNRGLNNTIIVKP